MNTIRVKKLHPNAKLPTYGSEAAVGADLYACLEQAVTIQPGEVFWVPTGIALEVPSGCAGLVYARSSMGAKRGLAPANKVGVIDSDYRGEICVGVIKQTDPEYTIEPFERIAQMVIMPVSTMPVVEVTELDETARGAGGFGSTGKN